jgi:hypothetical protein
VGVRISKSFKVAPGVRVRVNAKSMSVTLGGKGVRPRRRQRTCPLLGTSARRAAERPTRPEALPLPSALNTTEPRKFPEFSRSGGS